MNVSTQPSLQRVRAVLIKAGCTPCSRDDGQHPISPGFQIWKSQYRGASGPRFIAVQWVDRRYGSLAMHDEDYRANEEHYLQVYRNIIRDAGIEVYIIHRKVWVPLAVVREATP